MGEGPIDGPAAGDGGSRLPLPLAIFRAAVADKLIPESPCRRIKLPKAERRQVVPLATEAVEALIDAMPERYRALVVLAAGTGLRQGECFGLTLDRVDFLRGLSV